MRRLIWSGIHWFVVFFLFAVCSFADLAIPTLSTIRLHHLLVNIDAAHSIHLHLHCILCEYPPLLPCQRLKLIIKLKFLVPPAGSSPCITFDALNSLNLNPGLPYDAYSSGTSFTNSPARSFTPSDSICPPALTHLSGSESTDDMPSVGPQVGQ